MEKVTLPNNQSQELLRIDWLFLSFLFVSKYLCRSLFQQDQYIYSQSLSFCNCLWTRKIRFVRACQRWLLQDSLSIVSQVWCWYMCRKAAHIYLSSKLSRFCQLFFQYLAFQNQRIIPTSKRTSQGINSTFDFPSSNFFHSIILLFLF